jgi:sporulation protein YlmC with PRC-barrel domain
MMRPHVSPRKAATTAANIWAGLFTRVALWPDITSERERKITGLALAPLIVLGTLLFIVSAKPALSQGVQLVNVNVSVIDKGYRLSKLVGAVVNNDNNENIGKIDDIIIDSTKNMFAVLQVGGFLGLGSHYVAIPYGSLHISEDGKKIVLPGASKDELKKLAEFKYIG